MKKLKILHYFVDFSTLSEIFIYDLISGLEARDLTENLIVCRKRSLEKERPFKNVIVLKQKNPLRKIYYNIVDPKHLELWEGNNFIKVLEEYKPDIIHAHFGPAGIRINNFLNKYNQNVPLLVSLHGSDVTTTPYDCKVYHKNLLRINKRSQNYMTVPTSFLKDSCQKVGLNTEKIFVRNNTVNEIFLAPKEVKSWKKEEKLKIIIIGRLVEMKGHKYAIEAMKLLEKQFTNFELDIWGDGKAKEELLNLTSELGLGDKVTFKGPFNHHDLPEILSNYHLSITPSIKTHDNREESFCVSLVEASLMGLYCIASTAGGPNEVLKDNDEFKFATKDAKAIKDKVYNFVQNSKECMDKAKSLQSFMLKNYHPDNYFEGYKKIYESII